MHKSLEIEECKIINSLTFVKKERIEFILKKIEDLCSECKEDAVCELLSYLAYLRTQDSEFVFSDKARTDLKQAGLMNKDGSIPQVIKDVVPCYVDTFGLTESSEEVWK